MKKFCINIIIAMLFFLMGYSISNLSNSKKHTLLPTDSIDETSISSVQEPAQNSENPQEISIEERPMFKTIDLTQAIVWKDSTFESLIRTTLGKPSGDIYPSDLAHISRITIVSDQEIFVDPSGVWFEFSKNAQGEFMVGSKPCPMGTIKTLEDLKNFTNLAEIFCYSNPIENLNFAEYLPLLENLILENTNLTDISHLKCFEQLTSLELCYSNLEDISPLKNVIVMSTLEITHAKLTDISTMSYMSEMPGSVILSYNNISDISPLANAPEYAYINLRDNNISDISPLENCTHITILSLTNNNVSDVSPLKNLNKQNTIFLSNNPVADWSPLQGFVDIRK